MSQDNILIEIIMIKVNYNPTRTNYRLNFIAFSHFMRTH